MGDLCAEHSAARNYSVKLSIKMSLLLNFKVITERDNGGNVFTVVWKWFWAKETLGGSKIIFGGMNG